MKCTFCTSNGVLNNGLPLLFYFVIFLFLNDTDFVIRMLHTNIA